jgi:hypothetical protein
LTAPIRLAILGGEEGITTEQQGRRVLIGGSRMTAVGWWAAAATPCASTRGERQWDPNIGESA